MLVPPARRENISYDVLEFKREMLVHAVKLDKSMETVEKLLCYVFLFLGQAQKASGIHIAFQGMVAEQGALQVSQTKGQCSPTKGGVTVAEMLIAEQDVLRFVQKKRLFLKR